LHLKSLTLRGFKSFASSTTLRFEPGITCVVGPNGSGKSNVVDALAWVMGEQGAKSLRGGKMEDVIFAGTAGRPPLGRAEVLLTIDNVDGALPIDYTEVTISRLMYRSGESEYAINGNPCRLLDVQELLSDSGIGREMHVIVGQGQLDAVLQARPEDRRAFVEEAAGVLKHRKRKEKALRKLDAMQANLTRLQDLTAELHRQLKPLGRQAEVARRAAVIQADLRDARLRLLADDLVVLRTALDQEVADETAARTRRAEVETALAAAQEQERDLEAASVAEAPRLGAAQDTWFRLSSLRERLLGTASLAAERARHLGREAEEARPGPDPDELEAEARSAREQEAELTARLERDRAVLVDASAARASAESALAEEQRRLVAVHRAIADRREGLAKLTGEADALRSRAAAADAERGRLSDAAQEARARASRAQADFTTLESQVAGLDEGEVGLDERYERAAAALGAVDERLAELREQDRETERERTALTARRDALAGGLARKDGTGVLLAAGDRVAGLQGSLADLLEVEPGFETAVAAALGAAADAVAVASLDAVTDAITLLKADDAGRAAMVVGGAPDPAGEPWPELPPGVRYAVDVVTVPADLHPAITRLLQRVAVVATLDEGRRLVESLPAVRTVTRDGDVLDVHWAVGGSGATPSLLEVQAAVDDAEARLVETGHRADRLRFALAAAEQERVAAQVEADAALAQLHDSDARLAAVAERLGQHAGEMRAAAAEADRLEAARQRAEQTRDELLTQLAALDARLAAATGAPEEAEPTTEDRDRLAAQSEAARAAEVEARLAVRTGEERVRALAGRADSLERAAAAERAARERAAALREQRARQAVVATAVVAGARAALSRIDASIEVAAAERAAAEQARVAREAALAAVRGRSRELAADLERLTDTVHRDEVARAEQRLRVEALEAKALEDYGVAADALVTDYGPEQPVPPPADAPDAAPTRYERAVQEKRARAAERDLAVLGKVNPLALEEFAALEERHRFLSEQLEDLKATRRDLLTVVKEVDDRVEEVFRAAYEDTAREFEKVFATLFPGGEGRLVLTDPHDMLTTGIEVEARPPGKKVKRLSLLSGGERSLTAIALLVAIFRARPSPFYVLDEVEAALDDRNLGRLVDLLAELRSTSQLLIITHQKRTMEVADALYGVSMRGDGITEVISQRLREAEPA